MNDTQIGDARRPVKAGLLTGDLNDLSDVHLAGSRCAACAETTLGANTLCPNCGSQDVGPLALADRGRVWTYTIVRYKPPGNYKGPDPFVPFAMGLIELPDGVRVLAPIAGDIAAIEIGMEVAFQPIARPDGVVEFTYQPAA